MICIKQQTAIIGYSKAIIKRQAITSVQTICRSKPPGMTSLHPLDTGFYKEICFIKNNWQHNFFE